MSEQRLAFMYGRIGLGYFLPRLGFGGNIEQVMEVMNRLTRSLKVASKKADWLGVTARYCTKNGYCDKHWRVAKKFGYELHERKGDLVRDTPPLIAIIDLFVVCDLGGIIGDLFQHKIHSIEKEEYSKRREQEGSEARGNIAAVVATVFNEVGFPDILISNDLSLPEYASILVQVEADSRNVYVERSTGLILPKE